ncbi:MAG: hypothetical protein HY243_17215 [Proteobacteria bacterium]|nr:hypothetical protein [Pseudomonadota bacterium]
MKVRTAILGAVSALALSAVPALASNFSGTLSGDYANVSGLGSSANIWGVSGSGVFDVASNWAIGLDAGYHNFNGSGFNTNLWNVSGNAFYRAANGRIGAVLGYDSTDNGIFGSFHTTNYGGGGEWFASNMFTLAAKGGGFSGGFGLNGYYAGGAVTVYAMPDLGFSASYDYTSFGHGLHEDDWSVQGEWLVSEATPISVYGGYQGSTINLFGSTTANTWFVGLRLYTNGDGSMTLVDRQRNGTLGWTGSFSPLLGKVL